VIVDAAPDPTLPPSAYARMAGVLRVGLGISLGLLVVSLVAYLGTHSSESAAHAIATNPILSFLSAGGLAQGLATGNVAAYLTLGLLALVATPIVRVASGFYYFRRGGERGLATITFVVLILLLFGLLVLGPLVR
jgi:uncharacterized membrane protein